jgi:predicted GNAT family acetyltransferase
VSDHAVEVTDAPDQSRYEARVDGELAGFAAYRMRGERIVLTHTEVDPAYEGKGVGTALARAALDDIRERGLSAVVQCPFISAYIRRHPEYADLTG